MGNNEQFRPKEGLNPEPKDPAPQAEKKEGSGDQLPHVEEFAYIDRTVEKIGEAVKKLAVWNESDWEKLDEWEDVETRLKNLMPELFGNYEEMKSLIHEIEVYFEEQAIQVNTMLSDDIMPESLVQEFKEELRIIVKDILSVLLLDDQNGTIFTSTQKHLKNSNVKQLFIDLQKSYPKEWAAYLSEWGMYIYLKDVCEQFESQGSRLTHYLTNTETLNLEPKDKVKNKNPEFIARITANADNYKQLTRIMTPVFITLLHSLPKLDRIDH